MTTTIRNYREWKGNPFPKRGFRIPVLGADRGSGGFRHLRGSYVATPLLLHVPYLAGILVIASCIELYLTRSGRRSTTCTLEDCF